MMYLYTLLAALVVIVAIFVAPLRHKVWVATATIAVTAAAALTFAVKAFNEGLVTIATFSTSMFGEESYYTRMVKAGACGFLLKDSDIDEVVEAVETVMTDGSYFSPRLLMSITRNMRSEATPTEDPISAREREIVVAICRGLSNQEIADELFISKRTVDKHRANILEKTGCKNTAALVVYAIRNGLVEV